MSRKKHAEHANHERWLVSYADFITLLFAFFVVMFASSQVDKRKVGKVALAIQVAFQEMGIFEASNTQMPLQVSEPMPFSNVQSVESATRTAALGRLVSQADDSLGGVPGHGRRSPIQAEIEKALADEIRRKELHVRFSREGLVVSLGEVAFFNSGSAVLHPAGAVTLGKIAAVLLARPHVLRIEGHTDNVPIHNARFASNWELSTARAIEIIRTLIERHQFPPHRLTAAGYSEYFPIADNSTPQGRSANRRVDIVILSPPLQLTRPAVVPELPGLLPPREHR
jgi:chemotaxis protein MotB